MEKDEFIQLNNFNDANFVSQDEGAFNQTINIAVTNNFENFMFDIFVFEVDDQGNSADLDCYKKAVFTRLFNTNCDFSHTEVFTNREAATYILKTATESNDKDRYVVIDNTPFPQGGAYAGDTIVLEYSSSSTYQMSYNLRTTSIYMGIVSLVISFAIGSLTYLSIKIHRDIKKKFESPDEEEDEDEDEEEQQEQEEDKDKDGMNDVDLK